MGEIYFSRRQIVKTLLALGAGGVSLSYWNLFAGDDLRMNLAFGSESGATLETFANLSSVVTLRDDLDRETVSRMYKVFMDEPWAPDHIKRLHEKISAALGSFAAKKRPSLKDRTWKFDEGETWFTGHLLTTWYLGVYYHEQRPIQRIAYETALMFDATRGLLPVPLVESLGYAGWTQPPAEGK